MGIDVIIYVRTKDGAAPPDPTADRGPIWGGSSIRPAMGGELLLGATHVIHTGDRYWDERSDEARASRWPQIRRTLEFLLPHCDVWYLSDVCEPDDYLWPDEDRAEGWREFGARHLVTPERLALIDAAHKWATASTHDP